MNKYLKAGVVVCAAIIVSTLGIQASDLFQGISGSLTGNVLESDGPCEAGEMLVIVSGQTLCTDMYEASPGPGCPAAEVETAIDTVENMEAAACLTTSESGMTPWRFVSFTQAQQLCARSGKRLLTNAEWYRLVSGVATEGCIVDSSEVQPTGSGACVTPLGIHDQVGNLWEWVDASVIDGVYENRDLPEDGYVAGVDADGIVTVTGEEAQTQYGEDYVWIDREGVKGMIRGGFYGSQSDAGIFAINAAVGLDAQSAGVGFRCVRDVY